MAPAWHIKTGYRSATRQSIRFLPGRTSVLPPAQLSVLKGELAEVLNSGQNALEEGGKKANEGADEKGLEQVVK
jgi:hypothetical protein